MKKMHHEQLQELYKSAESYLLKSIAILLLKELEEYRQNFENYIEDIHNQTNESHHNN